MSLQLAAQHLASQGRGDDSVLVHMTPGEVRGLQELAMAHGGSLTINPETGLPEANFLKSLLPTIIGAALAPLTAGTSLAFLGNPLFAGMAVGGIEALRTGDLGKGLMAGFGAYSGANLTGALASAGTSAAVEGARASIPAVAEGEVARLMLETGADKDVILKQLQREAIEKATGDAARGSLSGSFSDRAMAGLQSLKGEAGRGAFMDALGGTTGAFQTAAGIAGPIAAAQDVQSRMPKTVTQMTSPTARITPYEIDEYGNLRRAGLYTPQEFVDRGGFASLYGGTPPGGAEGGVTPFAEGGVAFESGMTPSYQHASMSPGMLDFVQRSEPVVRMANGGFTDERVAQALRESMGQGFSLDQSLSGAANKFGISQDQLIRAQALLNPPAPPSAGLPALATQAAPAVVNTDPTQRATPTAGQLAAQQSILNNPQAAALDAARSGIAAGMTDQQIADMVNMQYGKSFSAQNVADFMKTQGITRPVPPPPVSTATDVTYGGNTTTPTYTAPQPQVTLGTPFQPIAPTMNQVRAAYEQGGGSTRMPTITDIKPTDRMYSQGQVVGLIRGYLKNNPNAMYRDVLAFANSRGIPEMQARAAYNEFRFTDMTPGMQGIYDYLMGRGPAPIKPYVPGGGPIMRSYREVMGIPSTYQDLKPVNFTGDQSAVASGVPKEVPTVKDPKGNRYSDFVSFYFDANPDVKEAYETKAKDMTPEDYVQFHYREFGSKPTEKRKGYYEQLVAKPATYEGGGASGGLGAAIRMGTLGAAKGGGFNLGDYSDGGRLLRGPGDGVSDSIPAVIGNKRPARLADGEFVVPARIVSELGNGSTEAGARKLYKMMERVQAARRKSIGKGKVAKNTRADKYLPV